MRKRPDRPSEENQEELYPPTALARNGVSPYFIGKPRRKHVNINHGPAAASGPPLPFPHRVIDERDDEEETEKVVIEEEEEEEEIIEIPLKRTENSKRKLENHPLIGEKSSIKLDDLAQSLKKSTEENKKPSFVMRGFDFGSDEKVVKIRDKICDIVDPTGARRAPTKNRAAIQSTLGSIYPSFMTAGGSDPHKGKFQVPLDRQNSTQSNGSQGAIGLPRKTIAPEIPKRSSFTNPSSIIKKAMGMETDGGGKDENVSGLRAEPTLKHFDENIISLIESEIMSVNTEIGWDEVAGLEGAKKALREIVVLPFKRPDVFTGIRAPPKGVLLFGPPGTGKTMIGRCVASQCRATFFNISASSLTSKWVGEGEKLVRALFSVARLKLPSVIFIDEVDSLLSARSESEHESSRRIKTEFLVQLDGVSTSPDERLLVLGATNRPQELDEAARRRFQKRLYIALPEPESRSLIVQNLLKGTRHEVNEQNLEKISQLTDGYSGADMRQLCTEAAMGPIRDLGDEIETIDKDEIRAVNVADFAEACRVVRPTVDESQLDAYAAWDKKFGCLPPPLSR
ncbi:unnamed protein product [Caenorhabditis sp. 36 PRJEB53466]|nr:unnamed protein product [Caenorhabditis sp. 36 PRJEB53466]